jgi:hypothetical protein
MKYTKEERILIAEKAIKEKNIHNICSEYDLSKSTIYKYIEDLTDNNNKKHCLQIYLNTKEYNIFMSRIKELGYEKKQNEYVRRMLINKNRITVNPNKLIDELYLLRSELNKIGSNLNQVANYTNFLVKNNYVEHSHIKELQEIQLNFESKIFELKEKINKTVDTI